MGAVIRYHRERRGMTREQAMAQVPGRALNWLSRPENDQITNLPEPELLARLGHVDQVVLDPAWRSGV